MTFRRFLQLFFGTLTLLGFLKYGVLLGLLQQWPVFLWESFVQTSSQQSLFLRLLASATLWFFCVWAWIVSARSIKPWQLIGSVVTGLFLLGLGFMVPSILWSQGLESDLAMLRHVPCDYDGADESPGGSVRFRISYRVGPGSWQVLLVRNGLELNTALRRGITEFRCSFSGEPDSLATVHPHEVVRPIKPRVRLSLGGKWLFPPELYP